MTEEWRDVPGYPGYQASSFGRIKGRRGGILSAPDRDGYHRAAMRVNGRRTTVAHHTMVALTYIGPRPDGHEIDHLDCQRANNAPSNLRYCTHSENMERLRKPPEQLAPRRSRATKPVRVRLFSPRRTKSDVTRGELNGRARLTEDQAREILALPWSRERGPAGQPKSNSLAALATRYGVSKIAISDLRRGATWKHLHAPNPNPQPHQGKEEL